MLLSLPFVPRRGVLSSQPTSSDLQQSVARGRSNFELFRQFLRVLQGVQVGRSPEMLCNYIFFN